MEGYGYLNHYGRFWLRPPLGHGKHENMSGIPQRPLLAIACHEPGTGTGRCRAERLQQTFGHQWSASYLINPLLLRQWSRHHFRGVAHQRVLSAGMYAIAFASQLCDEVHVYGYGNGACPRQCYHYYDCGPTAGLAGVAQSIMFGDSSTGSQPSPRATGGYHNFSAQARVLQRLASSGVIHAHWGSCEPTMGEPPADFVNRPRAPKQRQRGARRAHRRRSGRTAARAA